MALQIGTAIVAFMNCGLFMFDDNEFMDMFLCDNNNTK